MPASFKRMSSALLMSLQRWLADVVVLESAISLSYSLFDHCPSFWLLPVVNRSRKEIWSAKSAIQSIRPSWKLWLARRFSRVLNGTLLTSTLTCGRVASMLDWIDSAVFSALSVSLEIKVSLILLFSCPVQPGPWPGTAWPASYYRPSGRGSLRCWRSS